MPAADTLTIDVVSDVMCPWCYIGKRRLEKALARVPELPVTVVWHPFQLDPTLPPEGKDRQTYLSEKFGGPERATAIYDRIREAGTAEGIRFRFDKIERSSNTLDAHRVIRWAAIEGVQDAVVDRLFRYYFEEGGDLGDHAGLANAAGEAGMDREVVSRLLEGESDRDTVRADVAQAQQIGVTGVPTFIVDRRYAVVGAQEPEAIAGALVEIANRGGDEVVRTA